MIVSKEADAIVYTSNEDDFMQPHLIRGYFTGHPITVEPIAGLNGMHITSYSLTKDGSFLSFVQLNTKNNIEEVYLLNVNDSTPVNISNTSARCSSPAFSPAQPLLAYLCKGEIKLYNYEKHIPVPVINPIDAYFKTITWSAKGEYIFLEDVDTNIWELHVRKQQMTCIWKSPNEGNIENRTISPSLNSEGAFYFISDHESMYNQIYRCDSDGHVQQVIQSGFDKSLLQRPVSDSNIYYKSNEDGLILLYRFDGRSSQLAYQAKGVVYDFYPDSSSGDIVIYSDCNTPASIFSIKQGKKVTLAGVPARDGMPEPTVVFNKAGMFNLVFQPPPKTESKGWLVWLHGGPFEQVSRRYNSYMSALLHHGWGIIVLNYPGSTGKGNVYEQREMPTDSLVALQLTTIHSDLQQIRHLHPGIKKVSLLGISYGSKLAHLYAAQHSEEVTALIDFSGIMEQQTHPCLPTLYIYGTEDFAYANEKRQELIQKDIQYCHARELPLEKDGHFIMRKTNMDKATSELIDFVAHHAN